MSLAFTFSHLLPSGKLHMQPECFIPSKLPFLPYQQSAELGMPFNRAQEGCKQDTDKEKEKTTDSNQSLLYLRQEALILYQLPHTQHPSDTKDTSLSI